MLHKFIGLHFELAGIYSPRQNINECTIRVSQNLALRVSTYLDHSNPNLRVSAGYLAIRGTHDVCYSASSFQIDS